MQKIILFYLFTPIIDKEVVLLWQRSLAENDNLKGRIIISKHGINGTLGGDVESLKSYIRQCRLYEPFKNIIFKWSDGSADDFPRLSVKIRPEIVTFGIADELKVDKKGVVGGGKHISPQQVHELVEKKGDEVVFFDGRNQYEAVTGKFKNAIVPNVSHTRDFINELATDKYDNIKDKPVITYCTGGVRCEVLSMIMKKNGFKEVYQIDGGIDNYGKTYGDDGLWEGSLYTFDKRMGMRFSNKSKDIAKCSKCNKPTSNYENCSNKACNKLILLCDKCSAKELFCSLECKAVKVV